MPLSRLRHHQACLLARLACRDINHRRLLYRRYKLTSPMRTNEIKAGEIYKSAEAAATFIVRTITGSKVEFRRVPDDGGEATEGESSLRRFASMMTNKI